MSEAEGEGEVEYDFATQPYVQLFPGDDFVRFWRGRQSLAPASIWARRISVMSMIC